MKYKLAWFILFLILIPSVIALDLFVRPKDAFGNLQPNTQFTYRFAFSRNNNCTDIFFNHTENVITDNLGVAYIYITTNNISEFPKVLCEYRGNSLRAIHNFSDLILHPMQIGIINTTNITTEGGWFDDIGDALRNIIEGFFESGEVNTTNLTVDIGGTTEDIRKKAEYPCPINIPFFKRLFSTCKVSDNNICDDGEWFLMDDDCQLDNQLFFSMWFLRILLIIAIVLLAKNHRYFPVSIIIILLLLFINGAFTTQSDSANEFIQPFTGRFPSIINETLSCRGSDYLVNFGSCVAPDYPTLGWALGLILILLIYFIFKKLKSPGKETTKKSTTNN